MAFVQIRLRCTTNQSDIFHHSHLPLLIANDGYDVSAFELLEIPHPKVFCFGNEEKGEYFDVVKFFDDKWQFSYIENGSNKLAHSIEEAIMKNEWLK